MDELDVVNERADGSTTDHIIVSRAVWRDMEMHNRFEKIGSTDIPNRRRTEVYGFMGMRVWQSGALDRREKDALLLSEEVFDQLFQQSKDF